MARSLFYILLSRIVINMKAADNKWIYDSYFKGRMEKTNKQKNQMIALIRVPASSFRGVLQTLHWIFPSALIQSLL